MHLIPLKTTQAQPGYIDTIPSFFALPADHPAIKPDFSDELRGNILVSMSRSKK